MSQRPVDGRFVRIAEVAGPGKSRVVDELVADPGLGEVLVEVRACGVCAGELPDWLKGPAGPRLRLGHEPAGIVRAVGPGVTSVRPNDRVTGRIEPAFAEFVVADERDIVLLPEGIPFDLALGEPLGCLVEAERRTGVKLGDRVAIIGLGFMGLGMLQLLKGRGTSHLTAIDVRGGALDKALELGADAVHKPNAVPSRLRLTAFAEWESEAGFDVVVEASGSQAGLTLAGELVRAHGVLSMVGYHQGAARSVDMEMWNWKAIDVVNAHVRRRSNLVEATRAGLALMAAGRFSFEPLVTHRFGLSQLDEAFEALRDKPEGFIKAVVEMTPNAR
jgi:threonine dehydrogenase-like Zn-dependent dehydrogenase